MEIFTELIQGTPEWLQARAGVVTASNFSIVMAKGKKKKGGGHEPSKTRQTYMYELAGEILTGEVQESNKNKHMDRGNEMEPEARGLYELIKGVKVEQVGFIKNKGAGYSPDGFPAPKGLMEIKTRLPKLQIELLFSGEVPSEHMPQIQGGLWVSEREWCDFMSYWPGLPPFIKRVYRDEKKITDIAVAVSVFKKELLNIVKQIQEM